MPFVRIQLKSGRTSDQKKELAKEIINTIEKLDFATRESVRVIYEEMLPENFYRDEKKS